MKRAVLCLYLSLSLAACQPVEEPTATPSPTATPTPSPTQTLTPTPSTANITITLSLEAEQLPADGLTTRSVTAQVEARDDLFPGLAGLPLFFSASGGTFSQAEARLTQAENCEGRPCYRVSADYTTGEALGESEVTLRATLDVPNVGRAQGTRTIRLVRQELRLDLPPVYLVQAETTAVPLSFELAVDRQQELGGRYKLLARVANGGGGISTDPQAQPSEFVSLVAQSGPQMLYYTPPREPRVGGTQICVAVERRDTLPPSCRSVLWGYPVPGFSLFSNVTPQVLRAVDENVVEARLGSGADNTPSVYSLSYEVVLLDPQDNEATPYFTGSDGQEFLPNQAIYGELGSGTNYNRFSLSRPFNGVLRWKATTIGQGNAPVHRHFETFLAHQALALSRDAVLSYATLSASAGVSTQSPTGFILPSVTYSLVPTPEATSPLVQARESSLAFDPDAPMDWEYRVYALSPYDRNSLKTRVLARFFIPQAAFNPETGMFASETIRGRTRLGVGRDNLILHTGAWYDSDSMIFYRSPDLQAFTPHSTGVIEYYHLIYAFFEGDTRSLRP
ncbi:MAG: hypothetical protein RML73_08320 [Anaerolineae bacterium]|nr:hypothetical protein [Anaerolineae bacterium]